MSLSPLSLLNAFSLGSLAGRRIASAAYGPAARQRLDVYAPRHAPGPRPLVVFCYGGSWSEGDRRDYGFVGRWLAGLGYVAVLPDYRVLPEVEYPTFLEDCAAALRWAVANAADLGADPSRVGLCGHSAGAYNAVMLALDPAYLGADRERVRAVAGLSGPYDFFPFDVPVTVRTFGAVPSPELTQPVNLVTAAAPPMFLASGDRDRLVLPRNTAALARALRAAGVAVDERHYRRLGHAGPLLELGSLLGGRASLRSDLAGFLRARLG